MNAEHEAQLRDTFRKSGLRHTRQRELIYMTLAGLVTHPTADELHEVVKTFDSGVSLATVYNTLDALVSRSLCRKLPSHIGGGACRYDADLSAHVHISTAHGDVMDIPHELGDRLLQGIDQDVLREIERKLGVEVAGVSVQIIAR